ncbi:MAG: hypothetical protein EXX96DRAFT_535688 [Benjaminiella poitrasii]|nr:MAG: hypothetical protein EXX96DRAFT_535688 [Benjaminiella poitrasii]
MDNSQSTLLTLYDAITDSPIYRSTSLHFDDQLDLLEKWLESLTKYMKSYVEKLNKFNLETNTLCKIVIPVGIDDFMIDPNFPGSVIKSFSDSLQTSLAFKTKLVSDLEDNLIQPLQLFIKTHLKEFKDFRKQHEKILERYEAQLYRYTSQSKAKEASAVREEAFRLYEARKSYVRMSGQHVVRILHFRSILEHFLVERFTLATNFHLKEFEGGSDSWLKLQSNLISWKQWLSDDKDTCNYQLHQLQTSRITTESKYLNAIRPVRDLEKYNINAVTATLNSRHSLDYSSSVLFNNENQMSHKWGYLFARGTRNYWTRRWFFLYDGCFGSVNVNPTAKRKGTITMGERVSVLLCDIKPITDVDRRYCFEVMCAHQPPFVLQAETDDEMREWIGAFEKSKRLMLENKKLDYKNNTTATSFSTDPDASLLDKNSNELSNSLALNTNNNLNVDSVGDTNKLKNKDKPSIVVLSTSPDTDQQSTSLTPLLVWEASRATLNITSSASNSTAPLSPATSQSFSAVALSLNNPSQYVIDQDENNSNPHNGAAVNVASVPTANNNANNSANPSSWGIPWALVPSMFQSSNSKTDENTNNMTNELTAPPGSPNVPAFVDADGHQVIWPTRIDDSNVPKVDLTGYPSTLEARNKELRHVFGGVGQNEVVLTSFIGLLKKRPLHDPNDFKEPETPSSPILMNNPVDTLEQEFNGQLPSIVNEPTSSYGYAYTGRGFITQETFWFYSCVMMNCVNTVAIRLCDIKSVRLARDPSITNIGTNSNMVIAVDLLNNSSKDDETSQQNNSNPLIFTTLMDDVEVIAEKLKFAVSNAKSEEPESLQTTYDVIRSLSAVVNKHKNASNARTIIKSATVPIRPTLESSNSAPNNSISPILSNRSSEPKKKLLASNKTPRKYSAPVQPKSGALAAAMMAATVAGGSGFFDAKKGIIQNEDSPRHILHITNGKKSSSTSLKQLYQKQQQISEYSEHSEMIPLPSNSNPASPVVISPNHPSEEIKEPNDPFAPPEGFKAPSEPVSCGCDNHLDKLEAEIEVPISAKHLYYIMFSEDNPDYVKLWERKTIENKSKELTMTQWQTVDGKKERTLKYIVPVNNAMVKLKEAEVVEKQVVDKKDDYIRYVVTTSTKTAQLPYADAFIPFVKYCITWISHDRCKLSCYTGVKFIKNILVKGIVSKAAMKGMTENIAIFMPIIKNEANKQTKSTGQKINKSSSLKRSGTIKRPSNKNEAIDTEGKADEKQTGDNRPSSSGWYGEVETLIAMAKDLMDALPFTAKVVGTVIISLWFVYSWIFAGSRQQNDNMTYHGTSGNDTTVVSRAVYLRDIDEGLLNVEFQPVYEQSESFRLFFETTKSANRTLDRYHRWFSPYHHQFAVELLFSRERLAMLRHDTLVLFQLLNEVDAQLFENEYTNWLMDVRLHCHVPDVDYDAFHCDEVKRQLRSLAIGSYQAASK